MSGLCKLHADERRCGSRSRFDMLADTQYHLWQARRAKSHAGAPPNPQAECAVALLHCPTPSRFSHRLKKYTLRCILRCVFLVRRSA